MHWQCRSPSITYSSEVVMPKQIRVLIEISVHFSFEKSQVQHFCFWFKFQVGLTLSSPFQNHKSFKILLWFKYFLHVHLLLLHLVYFQKLNLFILWHTWSFQKVWNLNTIYGALHCHLCTSSLRGGDKGRNGQLWHKSFLSNLTVTVTVYRDHCTLLVLIDFCPV